MHQNKSIGLIQRDRMALWLARLDCDLIEQRLIKGICCAYTLRPDIENVYWKVDWSDMGTWTKDGSGKSWQCPSKCYPS